MPEAPATSIGAADGRLFRLRKTAMLSRHWRLWLSFPSPPRPLSPEERLAFEGCFFFGVGSACEVSVSPIGLVVVTAADRAAATCQRWATSKLQGKRPEGVAGAIGKPPPRVRRREILLVFFRRRRGTIRGSGWWKIYSSAVATRSPTKEHILSQPNG